MIVDGIRAIAGQKDVPVLGIGPASGTSGERPGHRPGDLLPGAQSLVSFGLRVPRAVYPMPAPTLATAWRSQSLTYRRLDTQSLRIAADGSVELEEQA